MALPSHNSNLKLKLIVGFGFTGFVLLFLLGYNLGSLNQDTKNQTLKTLRKKAHDTTQARLRSCQKTIREDKQTTTREHNDIKDTGDYVEILEKETLATDALSMELKEEYEHCMEVRRQGEVIAENLTAIIEHLQQQNTELLEYTESAGLNRTVEQKRNVMRGRIRALRLDNKAMRNRKAQRDLKIKQMKQANEQKEIEDRQKAEELARQEEERKAREEEKELELRKEEAKRARSSRRYEEDDEERPRRRRRYDDDREYEERDRERVRESRYSRDRYDDERRGSRFFDDRRRSSRTRRSSRDRDEYTD